MEEEEETEENVFLSISPPPLCGGKKKKRKPRFGCLLWWRLFFSFGGVFSSTLPIRFALGMGGKRHLFFFLPFLFETTKSSLQSRSKSNVLAPYYKRSPET